MEQNQTTIITNEAGDAAEMQKRVCKKCGRELPLEQFVKNKHGYTSICKECRYGKKKEPKRRNYYGMTQKPLAVSIETYSDQQLLAELKARGWSGTLTKQMNYEL